MPEVDQIAAEALPLHVGPQGVPQFFAVSPGALWRPTWTPEGGEEQPLPAFPLDAMRPRFAWLEALAWEEARPEVAEATRMAQVGLDALQALWWLLDVPEGHPIHLWDRLGRYALDQARVQYGALMLRIRDEAQAGEAPEVAP